MKINQILSSLLLIIVLLCIINYAIDCYINFKDAIKNFKVLFVYLIQYLIFRSWLFLIAVVTYFIIFNKLKGKKFILFKVLYILVISSLYAQYFYMDDYSLTIGDIKQFKLFLSCSLSANLVLLFTEFSNNKTRN